MADATYSVKYEGDVGELLSDSWQSLEHKRCYNGPIGGAVHTFYTEGADEKGRRFERIVEFLEQNPRIQFKVAAHTSGGDNEGPLQTHCVDSWETLDDRSLGRTNITINTLDITAEMNVATQAGSREAPDLSVLVEMLIKEAGLVPGLIEPAQPVLEFPIVCIPFQTRWAFIQGWIARRCFSENPGAFSLWTASGENISWTTLGFGWEEFEPDLQKITLAKEVRTDLQAVRKGATGSLTLPAMTHFTKQLETQQLGRDSKAWPDASRRFMAFHRTSEAVEAAASVLDNVAEEKHVIIRMDGELSQPHPCALKHEGRTFSVIHQTDTVLRGAFESLLHCREA